MTNRVHRPPGRIRTAVRWAARLCLLAGAVQAAALDADETRSLFEEGAAQFQAANELAAQDRTAAEEGYRKAILRWERIVRDGGIRNGKLHYNIGNAYFRMGDLGRAILHYRRAQSILPGDPNLRQNLNYARSRRLDRIPPPQSRRVLQTIFFWHYDFSTRTRSILFLVFFLGLWALAGARLFLPRKELTRAAVACGVVAACLFTSLGVEALALTRSRPGVIVAEEVVARKGDSESYAPSFTEPLHAGTEFEALEQRRDWLHVQLADRRTCWLPAHATILVQPPYDADSDRQSSLHSPGASTTSSPRFVPSRSPYHSSDTPGRLT